MVRGLFVFGEDRKLLQPLVCNLLLIALAMTGASCGGSGGSPSSSDSGGASSSGSSGSSGSGSGSGNVAPPVLVRTRYVRTDANTPPGNLLNLHAIVFNSPTNRFFVPDPGTNHVFVLDAATQQKIASIGVPGAFAIDQTPDQNVLWVGTQIGDAYTIDPVAMKVTKRYIGSQIGPFGFGAFAALPLADGRVALLGGQGGIPNVDGYSSFAIWSPADNSIAVYTTAYGSSTFLFSNIPFTVVCGNAENIGVFQLSPDRKTVFLGSIDSDDTLCSFDPSTGQSQTITAGGGFIFSLAVSPDGNLLALPNGSASQVILYDAHTLNLKSQFNVSGDLSSADALLFSRDSQLLFIAGDDIVFAYSVASQQQVGWFPSLYVISASGCSPCSGAVNGPEIQAIDNTGLIAGPMEEGVGFLDSAAMRTGTAGTQFTNAYLSPAFGAVSGGTSAKWNAQTPANAIFSGVFFGSHPATNFSYSAGFINATTQAGEAGPVDVYAYAADGGIQILPEGFSYGPTILEAAPNAATLEGGGVGVLYGYGFGAVNPASACGGPIPSDLRISVGGQPATIAQYRSVGDCLLSPPLPLQAVQFTIPPGTTGPADITVTNSTGSTTLTSGITYLPAIRQFISGNMSLAQGTYDPHRDLYYFTDADRIQVFSRTQGQWLSAITLSSAMPSVSQPGRLIVTPTPGSGQRLWGISLSPDGTKLAVGDAVAGKIIVFDPDNPGSKQTFDIPPPLMGVVVGPAGLAISDAGVVYFTTYLYGGTGFHNFFKLDTTTGKITDYGVDGPGFGYNDAYLRMVLTSDNARAYFNDDGELYSIDTATDKVTFAADGPHCCYGDYDLTLSSNQTGLFGTGYFFDTGLNGLSYIGLNHREVLDVAYLYGAKLSPDGSLLFQPTTTGIDVYDGHIGTLRARISLPVQLSPGFDSLVSDGKDNVLVAITGQQGNGIAIIDLTSLAEPAPFPSMATGTGASLFQAFRVSQSGAIRPPRSLTAPISRKNVKHVTRELAAGRGIR